ncbi:hypothetical protein Y88_0085 [Novosphingobium nitrogenifigens DSM 19370]|uniref:DUF11 domain-containing protein n=1 Tax=Novosphingobium nitrogenifigens DSM 19370 TaxID=983920 RepID=F1ZBI0_9SPHN|nr:hypothetical protein [Novosphingobium nitrogenifigens]EGD58033.1 hypothetical protein Y88_0085 [Novosphingobium nitrogenifigens DSM 19370]
MQRTSTFRGSITLPVAAAFVGCLLGAQPALASGTLAGTLIQNTATATFSSGTSTSSIQSNTVTVKVDQLVGVAVTALTTSPVTIGSSTAVLAYQVSNTGNGNDTFNLTGNPTVSGNGFTATLQTVAIDTNGNGTYDPGVDTTLTNGTASPEIAPDGSIKVFLVTSAPSTATDTQTSQVRLTATSATGSGTPGTLLAGKGVGGVDAVVGASGGTANALASLIASLATVTLTKSAAVSDPYGGTLPVPGATVTYSIVAHTAGSGTASSLQVSDAFPTGTTYQAGTLTLNGSALTDASDSDAGTATTTGVAVSLGNVTGGGADKTITFKVKIN